MTQLRRHFTVCDSNVLMYDMMKVLADRALRRSFTARGERNCAVAYLACILMRTCEKKKPPPSLTLRGSAGKDWHFLDFMHHDHVNTAYGLSILRLLYSNNRLRCQFVTLGVIFNETCPVCVNIESLIRSRLTFPCRLMKFSHFVSVANRKWVWVSIWVVDKVAHPLPVTLMRS